MTNFARVAGIRQEITKDNEIEKIKKYGFKEVPKWDKKFWLAPSR
jgi:hypothetical protein